MDMFTPKTQKSIQKREGGSVNPYGVPRDAERHAAQAALAQQQGGVRKEPVLLIKTAKGYELLEGWHRTIQHFVKYPEGYTGPAYVAVAQGQQGVAEESNTVKKDPKTGKVKSWSHEGDWEKVNSKKDPKGKVHNLTGQALKKTKELNLEEDQMGLGYDLDNLYESKLQMMLDEAVKQTALGKFRSEADKRKQKHDQIAAKQTKDGSGMSSAIDRLEKHVNAKEGFDGGGEYNDEVGMIRNDLHTMVRCAAELNEILKRDENIAEWVQEKIAVAKSMMVTILDYVASEHEMGNIYRK
jgi:hypothetical protein